MRRVVFSLLMMLTHVFAASAHAQPASTIDEQLSSNLDLRDTRFKPCFGVTVCEIDGYRILGWRRASDLDQWRGATLYWDPIDGIGIQGGGQDDEIDYNERVIVEFPYQLHVRGVWLSDLFISEDRRYNSAGDVRDSVETAGIEFRLNGNTDFQFQVSGNLALPDDPFNENVAPEIFIEGGDLRQRLVINGDQISILSATTNSAGDRTILSTVSVDQLDPEKQELFATGNGAEYDLSAILSDGIEFTLENDSPRNIELIDQILESPALLQQIRQRSKIARTTGDVSNGEILASWSEHIHATSVMFYSLPGTSNDFSVAGLIVSDTFQ